MTIHCAGPAQNTARKGTCRLSLNGVALVSFRINMANSLLEAQVEGHPGWLLACHKHWSLSLGTLLCRQLGYLRWAQQRQPLRPLLALFQGK